MPPMPETTTALPVFSGYRWAAPRFRPGARVRFELWSARPSIGRQADYRNGTVVAASTGYGPDGTAFHTYSIIADDLRRPKIASEERMWPLTGGR